MKPTAIHSLIICCLLCLPLQAQSLGNDGHKEIDPQEVQKAIAEFNRLKGKARTDANEVTVVLDPPVAMEAPIDEGTPEAVTEQAEESSEKPVLVTGKPPRDESEEDPVETADPELADIPEINGSPAAEAVAGPAVEVAASEPEVQPMPEHKEPGLEVRVESIRQGSGKINPEEITLKASFPAKPLSEAPAGWAMARSGDAPEFKRTVELHPGTTIALSIRPHVLAPGADGVANFAIREPGFETGDGYLQKDTVSAILGRSVVQLDEDSKKIGEVIEELHLILASLPKPETQPEDSDQP